MELNGYPGIERNELWPAGLENIAWSWFELFQCLYQGVRGACGYETVNEVNFDLKEVLVIGTPGKE